MNTSLKVIVQENMGITTDDENTPKKLQSTTNYVHMTQSKVPENQKIQLRIQSPPPQIAGYLESTEFSDEEEIEKLGLNTNEWNLQLKFDEDNLVKHDFCECCWRTICFLVCLIPCYWCIYRSTVNKVKRKKVILTEQNLIINDGEYCCFCCPCDYMDKVYSLPVQYESMTIQNINVTNDCCCCCGVKSLQFRNVTPEKTGFGLNLIGLSDPEGIRKLMLKIRDEKKNGNIQRDKNIDAPICSKDSCSKQTKIVCSNDARNVLYCQKCHMFMPYGYCCTEHTPWIKICYKCAINEMENNDVIQIKHSDQHEQIQIAVQNKTKLQIELNQKQSRISMEKKTNEIESAADVRGDNEYEQEYNDNEYDNEPEYEQEYNHNENDMNGNDYENEYANEYKNEYENDYPNENDYANENENANENDYANENENANENDYANENENANENDYAN
eukprot:519988_1